MITGDLTMEEHASYEWSADSTHSDLVQVGGQFTVPDHLTVNAVTPVFRDGLPLVTFGTAAGNTNSLPSWIIKGIPGLVYASLEPGRIVLRRHPGALFIVR